MRRGLSPTAAAEEALNRVAQYYPKFTGALIAINITGHYGNMPYSVISLHVSTFFAIVH